MASSIESQIGWAEIIFAGTVQATASVELSAGVGGTRYRFAGVRYLKGTGPTDGLILLQAGAPGAIAQGKSDEVRFEEGRRYIVFATGGYGPTGSDFHAMGCGKEHPFEIWKGSGSDPPEIRGNTGRSVVGCDEGHVVLAMQEQWSPELGPWRYVPGSGHKAIQPPPGGIPQLVQYSDSVFAEELGKRGVSPDPGAVRWVYIFPHQDPGTRATEDQFLECLAALIGRHSPPKAEGGR